MKFSIEIETENEAFKLNTQREIARILQQLADRLRRERVDNGKLLDINGNSVGTFWTTEE